MRIAKINLKIERSTLILGDKVIIKKPDFLSEYLHKIRTLDYLITQNKSTKFNFLIDFCDPLSNSNKTLGFATLFLNIGLQSKQKTRIEFLKF